jgi:hypothetical protein
MEPENQEHSVEKWLDIGLKRYGEAEPRPGLEVRILAGLRTEQARRASPLWQWWPALAAIVIVAAVTLPLLTRKPVPTRSIPVATYSVKTGSATLGQPTVGLRRPDTTTRSQGRRKKVQRQIAPAPAKLLPEQFPSPRPLSPQEELLLAYVKQVPAEEVAVAADRTRRAGDLQIDDLEIAPLSAEQAAPTIQQSDTP